MPNEHIFSADMSSCSVLEDTSEEPVTEIFSTSSQLYRFLSTRLRHLAHGIRSCLEFVSGCILYLLGLNHQMFHLSGSGDGDGAIYQTKKCLFHKKTHKSQSYSDCVRKPVNNIQDENEIRLSESFSVGIMKNEKNISGVASSSAEDIMGESGNEADLSDSETSCCFGVRRLRRLVKRQSKEKDRSYKHYRRRHLSRYTSKSEDQAEKLKQPLTESDGMETNTNKIDSMKTTSIEEKQGKEEMKEIEAVQEIETMPVEEMLQHNSQKSDAEQCNIKQDITPEGKLYFKENLSESVFDPKETCEKILTTATIETTRPTDQKPVQHSQKSVLTKKATSAPSPPASSLAPTKTSRKALTDHDESDYKESAPENTKSIEKNAKVTSPTVSAKEATKGEMNKLSKEPLGSASAKETIKCEMNKLSKEPLASWEERYIREVFKNEQFGFAFKSRRISTMRNVMRLYCITTQAVHQKLGTKDELLDDIIHACRRSIKSFVMNREVKPETKNEYFKKMINLYDEFKKYAAKRNHDISRFIHKAKNTEECNFLINTNKIMVYAKRRLTPEDLNEEQLTSIRSLFEEDPACTQHNKTMNTVSDAHTVSAKKKDKAPKSKLSNAAEVKTEVHAYLSKFGGENAETNASFQSAIGSLSDHFAQLFTETKMPKETPSLKAKVQSNEAISHETTSRKTEERKNVNFRIVHYNAKKPPFVPSQPSDKLNIKKDKTGKKSINQTTVVTEKPLTPVSALSPIQIFQKNVVSNADADIPIQVSSKPLPDKTATHNEGEEIKEKSKAMKSHRPKTSVSVQTVETYMFLNTVIAEDLWKELYDNQSQESEIKKTTSEQNCVCIENVSENVSDDLKKAQTDEAKQVLESTIANKESQTDAKCNMDIPGATPPEAGTHVTTETTIKTDRHIGSSGKKTPPPVPKKPKNIKTVGEFLDECRFLQAETRLHKTLKVPPPVPKKPETRRAGIPAETFRDLSPGFRQRSDENNSFSPEKKSNNFGFNGNNANTNEFGNDKRILQGITCSPKHHQEIVIQDSTGYEIVSNHGKKSLVQNILDFEFEQSHTDDRFQTKEAVYKEYPEPDFQPRFPVEREVEKYEEHFEIDNAAYDQSGCKIMPGSCTKVNRKQMEMKDKRKMKTKGVANKHLLKAFNDADQGHDFNGVGNEECLQYLDDIYGTDDEAEKDLVETDEEKDGADATDEPLQVSETTNVSYVEDVRHWEMLPTEVRRKNDDEVLDEKYNMALKSTPDEKKKGKKKKEKKQKAQLVPLKDLAFQFQR